MAINVKTKYPANAAAPSTDYLTGSFQNDSSPEAEDGTPLEKDWANDFLGARDAILSEGGVTPSGDVETAQSSDVLSALLNIISDNQELPPSQTQAIWNAGTSTNESSISPDKLDEKIKTLAIGEGQSWQNLTANRESGVIYTNTTGRSIEVLASAGDSSGNGIIIYTIDSFSQTVGNTSSQETLHSFSFTVPNGSTYSFTNGSAAASVSSWLELR